jgi:hypothetical protein
MKNLVVVVSILAFGWASQTADLLQEAEGERGSPDELKGVMKVWVDPSMEKRHRGEIVKEIQKKLPDLEIVPRPEDSDIHLKYSNQSKPKVFDERIPGTRRSRGPAVGRVVKIPSPDRERLLFEYVEEKYRIRVRGGPTPAQEFAREFIKIYLAANRK